MLNQPPLVSIIIPAYNAETFIAKTLKSVLDQSYRNIEVIVVDDGSQDRTPQIVEEFMQLDERIKLLTQVNSGVASARNLGIQHSKGEFIAPIDADDLWFPNAVAKLVKKFEESCSEVGVAYAWAVDIDEREQPTGGFHAAKIDGYVYKTLICHNFLGNSSSTLIRRSCFEHIGVYDTQLKAQKAQGCEDWDLYIRLAETYKFAVVPEFLIGYRRLSTSMSQDFSQMARSHKLMLQKVQKQNSEIPNFLHRLSCSSFYLYLAYQCNNYGKVKETFVLLFQAFKVDFFVLLLRPEFTILLVKSIFKLFFENRKKIHCQGASKAAAFHEAKQENMAFFCTKSLSTHPFRTSRIRLWLKVVLGSLLHRSLSLI